MNIYTRRWGGRHVTFVIKAALDQSNGPVYWWQVIANLCLVSFFYWSRYHNFLAEQIRGAFNKFPDFFVQAFKIVVDSWKFNMLLLYILWTATTRIGIHPTKAWLSQLVNFRNAIWTWGRLRITVCNEILFKTWIKCHRNVWNTSDCFSTILHESSISFWVA